MTSNPLQDVLSAEEYEKVQAEYQESQIQAKKEGSEATAAGEEEERPPGEDNPADDGKESVLHLQFNVMRLFKTCAGIHVLYQELLTDKISRC